MDEPVPAADLKALRELAAQSAAALRGGESPRGLKRGRPGEEDVVVMQVPDHRAGEIIGRWGKGVKEIELATGAVLKFEKQNEGGLRKLWVKGDPDCQEKARAKIQAILDDTDVDPNLEDKIDTYIELPKHAIGKLIGKNGSHINRIQDLSRASVIRLVGEMGTETDSDMVRVRIGGRKTSVHIACCYVEMILIQHERDRRFFNATLETRYKPFPCASTANMSNFLHTYVYSETIPPGARGVAPDQLPIPSASLLAPSPRAPVPVAQESQALPAPLQPAAVPATARQQPPTGPPPVASPPDLPLRAGQPLAPALPTMPPPPPGPPPAEAPPLPPLAGPAPMAVTVQRTQQEQLQKQQQQLPLAPHGQMAPVQPPWMPEACGMPWMPHAPGAMVGAPHMSYQDAVMWSRVYLQDVACVTYFKQLRKVLASASAGGS